MFSDPDHEAIEIKGKEIYKQICLCWGDESVDRVPILKQVATITLTILDTLQSIRTSKLAYQRLINHAADLIVSVWRSYKKSKFPEQWLSHPLENILQELLEILTDICEFVQDQVSTNMVLRMMSNKGDAKKIDRFHRRLNLATDKFEIESHIATNRTLLQVLEKQKKLSDQIQNRGGVTTRRVAGGNSTAHALNVNSPQTKVGTPVKPPIGVSTTLRAEHKAGSGKAVITKGRAQKIPRKVVRQTPKASPKFEEELEEEYEEEDEPLPKSRRRMNNISLPSSSIYPPGAWTHPFNPSITFSNSGTGKITIGPIPGVGDLVCSRRW